MTSDSPSETGNFAFTKTWTLGAGVTSVTARLACPAKTLETAAERSIFDWTANTGMLVGFDAHSVHRRISILANDSDRYCLRGPAAVHDLYVVFKAPASGQNCPRQRSTGSSSN